MRKHRRKTSYRKITVAVVAVVAVGAVGVPSAAMASYTPRTSRLWGLGGPAPQRGASRSPSHP